MNKQAFNFLEYANSIERMMSEWYQHSQITLSHSGNLGRSREHFIKEVLSTFLPKSVVVGSGEITDGDRRSGQQDIIIYRSDFPVITGFGIDSTYLIEGVVATIEVKSDLSSGKGLHKAFQNVEKVLMLAKQGRLVVGSQEQLSKLQQAHTAKTYVVAYNGWKSRDALLENYRKAANETRWNIPDIVYQPGSCVVNNRSMSRLRYIEDNQAVPATDTSIAYCDQHPFAVFLQDLLRSVIAATGGLMATAPGINALMLYDLNNHFKLPKLQCIGLKLLWNDHDHCV